MVDTAEEGDLLKDTLGEESMFDERRRSWTDESLDLRANLSEI